ncbi:transposase [Planctomycetales bacterium ZRK34]|nr:transposase [Planctomycetales bacterium ZRK34]
MATAFDDETYGQRWQVETVMFMLKRHFGSALTSRKYQTRRREMNLRAVTHNLMILRFAELFYRAFLTPYLPLQGIPDTLSSLIFSKRLSKR